MIATQRRLAKVLEVLLAASLVMGILLTLLAWLWLGVKQEEAINLDPASDRGDAP